VPRLLRPDVDDEVIDAFMTLVNVFPPPLPEPGHQAAWQALDDEDLRNSPAYKASAAARRLLDLGAATEDLYAFAVGVRALALADALNALDPEGEGELAGEFYGGYLEPQ
jgi:hypothetical protein